MNTWFIYDDTHPVPAEVAALNAALAKALREGSGVDRDAARAHLMTTLRARLAVTSPAFDLSDAIE